MIVRLHHRGETVIGVYFASNDDFTFIPPDTSENVRLLIEKTLRTSIVETTVLGTSLVGVFTVLNSHGIVVPYLCDDHELSAIKEEVDIPVMPIDSVYTALKNLVVANDEHIFLSSLFSPSVREKIKAFLKADHAHLWDSPENPLLGGLLILTNRGGVVSPLVSPSLIRTISRLIGFDVGITTVNSGFKYTAFGLVANSKGAIAGLKTTGLELATMAKGLRLTV